MVRKITISLPALDDEGDAMSEQISDAFREYAPSLTADLTTAADSGFRALSFHYNVITKKFDVSIAYTLKKRLIFYTVSAGCPSDAISALGRGMQQTGTRVDGHMRGNLDNIEFHFKLENDDEYAEENEHPF